MSFTSLEQMGNSLLCTTFRHTGYWTKATLQKGDSMEPTEPPLDPPLLTVKNNWPLSSLLSWTTFVTCTVQLHLPFNNFCSPSPIVGWTVHRQDMSPVWLQNFKTWSLPLVIGKLDFVILDFTQVWISVSIPAFWKQVVVFSELSWNLNSHNLNIQLQCPVTLWTGV